MIDSTEINVQESQTYFLKRFLFNESKNKELLVVSTDGKEVAQYKVDPYSYEYNGRILSSNNYPETYFERSSIIELTIVGDELTLPDYNERYENWLLLKRTAFEKKIAQIEEENKRRLEERQRKEKEIRDQQWELREYQQKSPLAHPSTPINSYDVSVRHETDSGVDIQCDEEILKLMEQQDMPAIDSRGIRWIKCEKCGCIGADDIFVSYGGKNHVNLGICYDCSDSKRPANI